MSALPRRDRVYLAETLRGLRPCKTASVPSGVNDASLSRWIINIDVSSLTAKAVVSLLIDEDGVVFDCRRVEA